MRKIGILTFWDVPNYGAFLQAYALQKILSKRYPTYDVRQIAYLNPIHYSVYYENSLKQRFRYWMINPKFYRELFNSKDKNDETSATRKFLDYYKVIPHFSVLTSRNISDLYMDVLVLGSDIIWDYTVKFFGKDRFLFGCGINAKRKISYAPGFGSARENQNVPAYVKKGLHDLDAISVRDKKSARIVKYISGRDARIVLDPTLLWEFREDPNIVKPFLSDYIVVYGSFFTDELIEGAIKYAKANRLKLVCLSSLDDRFEWCDQIVNQDEMNPFEWAGFFKYANAVMTCTYHGLMFSLIFNKKTVFNMTEFIYNKSESLVNELGLREVLVEYKTFEEKINWKWDYSVIMHKLEMMKKDSIEYLDFAIKGM